MRKKKRPLTLFRTVFLILINPVSAVIGLLLLLSIFSSSFNPAETSVMAIFGLFFPLFFSLAILSLLILILFRSKFAFVQIVILLLALPLLRKYVGYNNSTVEGNIAIMTYNVHGFRSFAKMTTKLEPPENIMSFINERNVDIASVQEFRSWSGNIENDLKNFAAKSGFDYYHFAGYWKKGGIQSDGFVILSKYPIVGKGSIPSVTGRNIGVFADIKMDSVTVIRLLNIHLVSFSLQKGEIDMFSEAAALEMDKIKTHGKSILGKLLNSFRIRAIELDDLRKFLKKTDIPHLITGDFNDTPASYTYSMLKQSGLKDVHLKSGRFLGATYAGNLPWLRIDYIFYSQGFQPAKSEVFKIPYSDHYPVIANLKYFP
jgi:endonuclease/exonuclease/phosphatase family metal-dependent hydrolase